MTLNTLLSNSDESPKYSGILNSKKVCENTAILDCLAANRDNLTEKRVNNFLSFFLVSPLPHQESPQQTPTMLRRNSVGYNGARPRSSSFRARRPSEDVRVRRR